MENVFDWHNWNAETYEKPEDIIRAFEAFGVHEKKIADIRIIGVASHNAHFVARQAQFEAGVPDEVIDCGGFTYSERTLVPCVIELIEPIILTFTDGSSFELQPRYKDSLKMSVNQIPPNIIDGSNHTNINASEFFRDLIGRTLRSLTVRTFIRESICSPCFTKEAYQFRRYQFGTYPGGDFGFSITQNGGGRYSVEVRNQKHFTYEGNEVHKIPARLFNKAFFPVKQIVIVEGHDYSSYFWINPVKIVDVACKDDHERINEYVTEEISIEEEDVFQFLYYFLEKHFNSQIQVTGREKNVARKFEWYLEHNIYTYESVQKIIAEIRATANRFSNDFGDPALSEIKARFNLCTLTDGDSTDHLSEVSPQRRDEVIRESIGVVLDFYERFCRRLELMIKHTPPQYDHISFMGP